MFFTKLYILCDSPACLNQFEPTGARALLDAEAQAREAGWWIDATQALHLCPEHHPQRPALQNHPTNPVEPTK